MKKVTITTEKVLAAYNVLSTAKYNKLEDADKIKVWKIARALKPIATKFDDDSKDAAEKMKFDGFDELLPKAQEYERIIKQDGFDASELPISPTEYSDFVNKFKAYQKLITDTVGEYAQKEVEFEIDTLSDDAFGKLMASNEWNMSQVVMLDGIVTD
jgi:hypothetical protein